MTIRRRPNSRSTQVDGIRLLDGWPVERLLDLEAKADRRLIGPLMAASAARRSAAFSTLAALDGREGHHPHLDGMAPQSLADWLLTAIPREIVRSVWGDAGNLATTIIKTLGAPLRDPEHYTRLATMMSGTSSREVRQQKCLLQAHEITSDLIVTLDLLRDAFLRPALVDNIAHSGMGRRIETVAKFLQEACPEMSERVLVQSLESRRDENIQEWATRMLLRHAQITCDLPDDIDFAFLRRADDFHRCARDYRNCLVMPDIGNITNAAIGLVAYAEYRHAPIIVELMRMHDGRGEVWICEGVHAPENGFVPDELEDEVRAKLRDRGVLSLSICARTDVDPDVAAQISFGDPFGRFPFRAARRRRW